jgi:hypothetical protein
MDRLSKGYLTSRDLLSYMKYYNSCLIKLIYRENGIDGLDEIDCKAVIKYFDSTGEGRLFYTE